MIPYPYLLGDMADNTKISTIKSNEPSGKGKTGSSSCDTLHTKAWHRDESYNSCSWNKKNNIY